MLLKVVIAVLCSLAYLQGIRSQCSVIIKSDVADPDPVYLRRTSTGFELWAPEGPSLEWVSGGESAVICSGSSNQLTLNTETGSIIQCQSGTTFIIGDQTASTSTLACKNRITGDTVNTGVACTLGGTLINLGFNTNLSGFVTYIESCYDMTTGSVRYTMHKLPGAAIDHAVVESSRPSFKTSGSASHVSPAVSYTQASQLARFGVLLGSVEYAANYIYTNSYLARGHLSPDGDGIFRSWQFTTYFYTNVAPEWQVVNAGNWLRVENAARSIAAQLQQELTIYQGVEGILTLPDINGVHQQITLEAGGNIEVPKWFWKIVKSTEDDAGIAFVTLNNPFVTSLSPNEMLCQDICETYGWADSNYANFARGYTYCCDVADLMRSAATVPAKAAVQYVLKNK